MSSQNITVFDGEYLGKKFLPEDSDPCKLSNRSFSRILIFFMILALGVTSIATSLVLLVQTVGNSDPSPSPSIFKPSANEDNSSEIELRSVFDYYDRAKEVLDPNAFTYIEDAATLRRTYESNLAAFKNYYLRPRVMVNVSEYRDTSVTIQGRMLNLPIGISPTAFQTWYHEDGERAMARAAMGAGTIMVISTSASTRVEDIREAAPNAILWQQIYMWAIKDEILHFIRRAESLNFAAILVTCDRVLEPIRYGSFSKPRNISSVNFSNSSFEYLITLKNLQLSWSEITWLKNQTNLPIITKGILSGHDANAAVEAGVDAVYVSNHGGRVTDTVPATVDVLREVISAVKGRVPVYFDSGIRTGLDVFKVLAMGADMVFVGRAALYGLAVDGQLGVEDVLDLLKTELINTMGNCGASGVSNINSSMVMHQQQFSNHPEF